MPQCHQCKQDAPANTRTGKCGICFLADAVLCASCAMWEFGPNETTSDFFADLARESGPLELSVQRQHSDESEAATSSLSQLPLACDLFFAAMEEACPYIENQLDESVVGPGAGEASPFYDESHDEWMAWRERIVPHANQDHPAKLYGESFRTYTCSVLDKFRELYPSCKYDRVAIQVLLIMHLSAQERVQCRYEQDGREKGASFRDDVKYLKRWQTRPIAVAHLQNHLDDIGAELGSAVKDALAQKTWTDALGLDDLELFLKGRKPATVFAIDLLQLAGSGTKARETLEIAVILYHALTATRAKSKLSEHWSQTGRSFALRDGLGLLSKSHYESLYGATGDGSSFDASTTKKLNELWQALADTAPTNTLPAHPRFADLRVPTSLPAVERDYLQYLPVFDHPKDEVDQRSECERIVRARVEDGVKAYYDAYLKDVNMTRVPVRFVHDDSTASPSALSRTLKIDVADLGALAIKFEKASDAKHISTHLSADQQDKIRILVEEVNSLTYLQAHPAEVVFKISYERGNQRRLDRRDAIINEIKTHLKTHKGFTYRLEYSNDGSIVSHDGTVVDWSGNLADFVDEMIGHMQDNFYVDQCFDDYLARLMLNNAGITPKAWFPLKLQAKPYSEIFPDCEFDDSSLFTVQDHYEPIGGTSKRPPHYMDWRNHKDIWLYDGFKIDPRRRPLFCSLSVQPLVPEPNSNYGLHTMLFKRSTTRHRCIHTFGDKQQPRRSMLLLLDDLLYEHTKKDGSKGQTAKARTKVLDDLFRRIEMAGKWRTKPLEEQWERTLSDPPIGYPDGDGLIECQIFGPVVPATDLLGLITRVEDQSWMDANPTAKANFWVALTDVDAKQHHLDTHYGGTLLAFRPSLHTKDKRDAPPTLHPQEREDIIDKKAEDNADRV